MKTSFRLLIISSIITPLSLYSKFSMDRVYSFFGKYTQEAVIEKEHQLTHPHVLVVKNIDGNITITTDWKKDSICMKATKRATKVEDLELITIQTHHDPNQLTIASEYRNPAVKGCVDYEFIVPAQMQVNLYTQHGMITINDMKGPIHATTVNGPIDIRNTTNTITAETEETGNITIASAQGNIKADTNKGNISITDATKSIIVSTQKGNIDALCPDVHPTSRIIMNAQISGTITLGMPSHINATVCGKTEKGKFNSEHYITLKPITMQLNNKSRKELLEKQVNGVIGTGEADIRLASNNGNIVLLETT